MYFKFEEIDEYNTEFWIILCEDIIYKADVNLKNKDNFFSLLQRSSCMKFAHLHKEKIVKNRATVWFKRNSCSMLQNVSSNISNMLGIKKTPQNNPSWWCQFHQMFCLNQSGCLQNSIYPFTKLNIWICFGYSGFCNKVYIEKKPKKPI